MNIPPKYVLVTPARNEAEFIELTIKSVVAQTIKPVKWVIVSDGSTDGMDDIVLRYAAEYSWIELVRMPARRDRHFAGKVHAFNAGYSRVAGLDYDIIANLDGDVSFDAEYFQFLLAKFIENPRLGVAGTPFREGDHQYDYRFTSIEHVSGQIQLFRRECFEDIGGFVARKVGGVDLVAVLSARMKNWETRTFLEKPYNHHRKMGTATQNILTVPLKGGRTDYVLGNHPVWQLFRCIYQMKERPLVIGGLLRLAGFTWALLRRMEKQVPPELVRFRRMEEIQRLRRFAASLLRFSLPITDPKQN